MGGSLQRNRGFEVPHIGDPEACASDSLVGLPDVFMRYLIQGYSVSALLFRVASKLVVDVT